MCLNTNRTIVNFVLCKNIDKLITVSRLANKGEVEKMFVIEGIIINVVGLLICVWKG